MKDPLEIIAEIRGFISSQNPIRFPYQEEILVSLLNELENVLNPVEEQIVLMKNEEGIFEEFTVNEEPVVESLTIETIIEEPIAEVVAPKKRSRKV
jgi:hypothetical protein